MADHIVKIEDGNGNDIAYTTSNDHSIEANREAAMAVFNQDVEHGFATGPGRIVGHSSYNLDALK